MLLIERIVFVMPCCDDEVNSRLIPGSDVARKSDLNDPVWPQQWGTTKGARKMTQNGCGVIEFGPRGPVRAPQVRSGPRSPVRAPSPKRARVGPIPMIPTPFCVILRALKKSSILGCTTPFFLKTFQPTACSLHKAHVAAIASTAAYRHPECRSNRNRVYMYFPTTASACPARSTLWGRSADFQHCSVGTIWLRGVGIQKM